MQAHSPERSVSCASGALVHPRKKKPIRAFGRDKDMRRDALAGSPVPSNTPLRHLSHRRHLHATDYTTLTTAAASSVGRTCSPRRALTRSCRPRTPEALSLPHVDCAFGNHRATSTVQFHPSSSLFPLAPSDGCASPSFADTCGARSWSTFGQASALRPKGSRSRRS